MYQPKLLKPMLICFQILYRMILINLVISCIFLSILKTAAITPVHKKLKLDKSNYRPVSVIPNISKLFERCMHRQISEYFETIFWKFQCGFRNDCLLAMVVNCKKALDQGKEYGALLTVLSKAFDCLPHDLRVAKLHAYGFSIESLKLINSYLTERKQRVKCLVHRGIFCLVYHKDLFWDYFCLVYFYAMFLFCKDVDFAGYVDDNTPYCIGKNPEDEISQLEKSSIFTFEWFEKKKKKWNESKS